MPRARPVSNKKDIRTPPRRGRAKAAPAPATRHFGAPEQALEGLDLPGTAALIAAVADLALVVDREGVIQDLAFGSADLPFDGQARQWLGQPCTDTVTVESRPKLEEMLREAAAPSAERRWRHINHPMSAGVDLPMMYSAVPLGRQGRVMLIGRDMRALSGIQQRLVDAQQALERDYWRLRHLETRYRLLFEQSSEALLVLDGESFQVIEANPTAQRLFGTERRPLIGQAFPFGLDARSTRAMQSLLARVSASGQAEDLTARTTGGRRALQANVSAFRHDDQRALMVRVPGADASPAPAASGLLGQVVATAPDGFVVTDPDGRVLLANAAFVAFCQLTDEGQLRGQSLDRWLGRPGVDFGVMQGNLRQHGSVHLYGTTVRGEHGGSTEVEISAVAVPDGDPPCLGFTVRHVGRRLASEGEAQRSSMRSVDQLTKLVGRVPLKDLVRESTDLIEQLCIEAALELTRDNRASAAELLGLSRQSLYVKLRRYGLGELGTATE